MDQPLAGAMRSIEIQKGEAFMEAVECLRTLTRRTLLHGDGTSLLAQRALSRLALFRQGEIPEAQKNKILAALVERGYTTRLDLGVANPETVNTLVRDHLWMAEVGLV